MGAEGELGRQASVAALVIYLPEAKMIQRREANETDTKERARIVFKTS